MSIKEFHIAELFNNSKGKTSLALLSAFILIVTGCFIGIKGAVGEHQQSTLDGIAYASLGATLLGIRRYTGDKEITLPENKNEKPNE